MNWESYLLSDNSINIIDPDLLHEYDLFFGPLTDEDKAKAFQIKVTKISEVLIALGLAESKTWCRKNNWDHVLRSGWTDIKFGYRKIRLCILTDEKS